jgi:cytochrome P450 PksS
MSSTPSSIANPLALGATADPFPHYAALRRDAPIFRMDATPENSMIPFGSVWVVSRYEEASIVLKDPTRFVQSPAAALPLEVLAAMPPMPSFMKVVAESMVMRDPPDHTRLRGVVNRAFTPRAVKQMEPRIQAAADRLLDGLPAQGEMDLVPRYAWPLPLGAVCDMIGVPEQDREGFRKWVDELQFFPKSPEEMEKSNAAMASFMDYAGKLVQARRKAPEDDLATALVQAEEAGDRLTHDELCGLIVQIIFAGHETIAKFLANAVLALMQKREHWDRLVRDPAQAEAITEELLRCASSSHQCDRWAAQDIELAGHTIKRGDRVVVLLPAVNRDPARFPNPEEVDASRNDKGHMSFGHGIHFCVGAPLARVEARIGLATLARRLPTLRLNAPPESVRWELNGPIRGVPHLPVAWG